MTLDQVSNPATPSVSPLNDVARVRRLDRRDRDSKSTQAYDGQERKEILRQIEDKISSMESSLRIQGNGYVSSVSRRYMTDSEGNRYVVGADISLDPPRHLMQALNMASEEPPFTERDKEATYENFESPEPRPVEKGDETDNPHEEAYSKSIKVGREMAKRDALKAYANPLLSIYRGEILSLAA
ncbi:hypothetical protein L2W58_06385 [Dethiosulfovibrio sp. F2B]|uniref:hypothetical protein n=1 Tax=Dethiosulfovibrio faecalis TaxID=2720018 RepID=UPI001F176B0E|nr:hypothetical protein [Dethiosulfovibrio faecalis]MCF4151427.1 hypothetical protein [Dethiosulfovibrio faecalis]